MNSKICSTQVSTYAIKKQQSLQKKQLADNIGFSSMPASFISNKERIFLFTEFKFWFSINKSMMELDFGRNLENILKMFRQKADLKIYTGSRQRMKEHCFVVDVYIPDNKKLLVSLQNGNKLKSILLAHASLFHVCADYQICRFVKKTNSLAYTQRPLCFQKTK